MKTEKIKLVIFILLLAALCAIVVVQLTTRVKVESTEETARPPGLEPYFDYDKFDFIKNLDAAEPRGQIESGTVTFRYLTLNGDKRECLHFPINSREVGRVEITYSGLKIDQASRLTFGIGLDPEDHFTRRSRIEFEVSVIDEGVKRKIFGKKLKSHKNDAVGDWHNINIDMSEFSNKEVDIVFTASFVGRGIVDAGAFWAEPILHNLPYDKEWPNIIFISIDTLRADHLGCYGYGRDTSPNVDRFAGDGVRYKYCVSQAPFTLTSYGSMFTGLYPNRGIIHGKLKNECLTIAEILSTFGYYTISFNGGSIMSANFGFDQGFRIFKSYPSSSRVENDIVWEFTNAMNALKREKYKNEKLFIFIHTYEVHSCYDSPEMYKRKFLRRDGYFTSGNNFLLKGDIKGYTGGFGWGFRDDVNRYKKIPAEHKDFFVDIYDAEINYMDVWLGRLLDFLKEEGMYDDTLIIFNADHGEEFYEHGGWSHSHQLYGELINVPLIIKYPRGGERGIETERIARSVDIFPTILHDVLGLDIEGFGFDGVPLSMPLDDSKTLSFQFKGNSLIKVAIFEDEYKLIKNFHEHDRSEPERPENELFLYRVDRRDTNEVNSTYREETEHLRNSAREEFELYKRVLELGGSGDFFKNLDEGAIENLKDLGYVQ